MAKNTYCHKDFRGKVLKIIYSSGGRPRFTLVKLMQTSKEEKIVIKNFKNIERICGAGDLEIEEEQKKLNLKKNSNQNVLK